MLQFFLCLVMLSCATCHHSFGNYLLPVGAVLNSANFVVNPYSSFWPFFIVASRLGNASPPALGVMRGMCPEGNDKNNVTIPMAIF